MAGDRGRADERRARAPRVPGTPGTGTPGTGTPGTPGTGTPGTGRSPRDPRERARPAIAGPAPRLPEDLVEDLVDAGSREHYADPALYDYEYRRRRADVTFYRELARRRGADRILELGAGTGRVTVPLARDGRHIVALDQSAAMLARLGERIARLPGSVAARITPVTGDLRTFSVAGRFPLVIAAFNVLEHLYTRGEVTACLQRVAACLAPGGAFAFDVQLPDLAWLVRDPSKRWAKTRFTDPTTGRAMCYSTNHDYDPVSQIALIRLYYEPAALESLEAGESGTPRKKDPAPTGGRVPPAGPRGEGGTRRRRQAAPQAPAGALATRVVKLSQRKFFPAELEALVAYAGFRVTERYGDFSFRPLDGTAESQVLVCEPAPNRPRNRPTQR
ncbi:MAG TPA: class I SAM-dependent methyltransferase [Kofleriaceae bacterium]|jgi:SAM-dependent methyltransferase|nr:class I SAM-dependent methyltransferase [Kofleriaceae bacterium]